MSPLEAITLFGVMVSLAALPSSSVALVVARSATLGAINGISAAVGIVLGDLFFIALALAGLSVFADAFGNLFVVVKVVGGLYLIWFGIKLLKSKPPNPHVASHQISSSSLITSFTAGVMLTLGDVKAIIFYASLFPAFVDITAVNTTQVATIVAITILSVGGVKAAYAICGARVANFAHSQKLSGMVQKATGSVLVGTGCFLVYEA